jgi:hypothetical protein
MALAAKAETATAFHNAQAMVLECTMLEELGHPQPPTLITMNNSTANGLLNSNIKQKRSNPFNMKFCWLRD